MSRLRIGERVKRTKRALLLLQWRQTCEVYSHMWFASTIAFVYTLACLSINDTPTNIARRVVTNFLSPQDCVEFLRFTRDQILLMLELLMVPSFIRTDCGFVASGREALCVLLYRLVFPCRLKDMRLVFGLIESCICETFNWMLHFMDFKWGFLFSLDIGRLVPKLRTFAEAIYNSGCPLSHCWGFIDGTVRGIARPIRNQRFFFNGYKRKHAIKFQGVVTPDGLFVDLYGAEVRTRHDAFLLAQSELVLKLQTHMNSPSGHPYSLYGDPAYGMSDHVRPFSASANGPLTPAMSNYNQCRVTVEWGFKEMASKWACVNMKCQQKFLLSPVAKQYKVSTLLSNFHSCLNGGNEISQYFGVEPPTLAEYLHV